jgi:hypothetical protein
MLCIGNRNLQLDTCLVGATRAQGDAAMMHHCTVPLSDSASMALHSTLFSCPVVACQAQYIG